MPVILKNEWKSGWKSLLIWALSVGGMATASTLPEITSWPGQL